MTARIQIRRDTSANWATAPVPTLYAGEIGLDLTSKMIKVGDGSSNWTSLPWLTGTLPLFSSPSGNLNTDTSNRVTGIYRFSSVSAITGGAPPAPIDIKAADGAVNMLVLNFGQSILQHLWTDAPSDNSRASKSYTRAYNTSDSTWRNWVAQNTWAIDASEGVDLTARQLTMKGPAGFSVGTAASPSITTAGDTDTGIYFPNANEISISTNATQAMSINGSQLVTVKSNLQVDGTLDMTSGLISNVSNPVSAQDAATKSYLETNRVGQMALIRTSNPNYTITNEMVGTSYSAGPSVFSFAAVGTTIGNLRCPSGQVWEGTMAFSRNETTNTNDSLWIRVTDSACVDGFGNAIGNSNKSVLISLIRKT